MESFFEAFPDLRSTEMRVLFFVDPDNMRPPDRLHDQQFLIQEFYCVDPECDCQRVVLKVIELKDPQNPTFDELATINYSWDPDDVMGKMLGMGNPFLDPLHYQAEDAEQLLDLVHETCLSDPVFIERLQRHRRMLREHVGDSPDYSSPYAGIATKTKTKTGIIMPTLTPNQRKKRRQLLNKRTKRAK
ncbi:hypothetical protein [Stieleria varia]|uniref:Uncharacterized protein n=1 Tax=Stieleria varia TaxID=2528005 RepID=A0A5C6AMS0_9BACT|nr:hypothetical protein [Stieleria varia]TWU00798.1 hypothetical protein Pla52n_41670 [Stieleria varia]